MYFNFQQYMFTAFPIFAFRYIWTEWYPNKTVIKSRNFSRPCAFSRVRLYATPKRFRCIVIFSEKYTLRCMKSMYNNKTRIPK